MTPSGSHCEVWTESISHFHYTNVSTNCLFKKKFSWTHFKILRLFLWKFWFDIFRVKPGSWNFNKIHPSFFFFLIARQVLETLYHVMMWSWPQTSFAPYSPPLSLRSLPMSVSTAWEMVLYQSLAPEYEFNL